MTRRSIMDYADSVLGRYFRASKKKKIEILDEFVVNTKLPGLYSSSFRGWIYYEALLNNLKPSSLDFKYIRC